ncbi:helix-turn-helix domain-containing protein [Streptomyces sp. NPDC003247]|uniref:helix-turn-helix domain-containing protein n=1 Tax=Streptomyces sp. NPDC003247 TaxID=3364677 RepID=UPI0036A7A915
MLLGSPLRVRTRAWRAVGVEGGVAADGMTMLCAVSSVPIFSRGGRPRLTSPSTAEAGHSLREVSRRLGIAADTVRTWRRRFLERGMDGLSDEPRPGVPRKITDADAERVIVKTPEEKPKNATHRVRPLVRPAVVGCTAGRVVPSRATGSRRRACGARTGGPGTVGQCIWIGGSSSSDHATPSSHHQNCDPYAYWIRLSTCCQETE